MVAKRLEANSEEKERERKGGAQKDSPATVTIVANQAIVRNGARQRAKEEEEAK